MSERPEAFILVRKWIEKAENDLINAEHTLTMTEKCPFDTVCFHAQQCAEKYLKAFLLSRSIEFPKTHDLRLLIQMVHVDDKLDLDLPRVLGLNRYSIESRYPDDFEAFTRQEAEEAVKIARQVRKEVRNHLPDEAFTEKALERGTDRGES